MNPEQRAAWRLLPNETVLWHGRPAQVPTPRPVLLVTVLLNTFGLIAALFAGLLAVADLSGASTLLGFAALLGASGIAYLLVDRQRIDGCEYLLTNQRVLWRREPFRRQMDRASISFGRLRHHPTVALVADIELVVAVPFGPLLRKQRLVLHAVRDPDSVFALIRGVAGASYCDDTDLPLIERLDPGEAILWAGRPEGGHWGWRELTTALLGATVGVLALAYGFNASKILIDLETIGLPVRSLTWLLFFLPVLLSWVAMFSVGVGLLWWGLVRAYQLAMDTDYLLTDRRMLVRRGRVELSIDRRQIVDLVASETRAGLWDAFLMLDSPRGRALGVSGALGPFLPSRDGVPPILYAIRDLDGLKRHLLGPVDPSMPSERGARDDTE